MKLKIVKFENGLYGVRTGWLWVERVYLNCQGFLVSQSEPCSDPKCSFVTLDECEEAIRLFKLRKARQSDNGKIIKSLKVKI